MRNYTGVLDFTANIFANHDNASGVPADPQVQKLVNQTRDLTRRELLTPATPSPGAASPAQCSPGAAEEPSSGGASPPSGGGASPKIGDFRRPPFRLQREGGPLCPTTGFFGPASSRSVLPWSRRAWLPVTGEYAPTTQRQQQKQQQQEQQEQQPRGSGGTFPAEYAAQAVTSRSLHQHGHTGYYASARCRGGCY